MPLLKLRRISLVFKFTIFQRSQFTLNVKTTTAAYQFKQIIKGINSMLSDSMLNHFLMVNGDCAIRSLSPALFRDGATWPRDQKL